MKFGKSGIRSFLATATMCGGLAVGSTAANAITFDFAALADNIPGIGGFEENWSVVAPTLTDGTPGDNFWTISGLGVTASGSNVNGTPADAFLDSGNAGLGVCSSASCTSGVSGAITSDDNVSGNAGGEKLTVSFTKTIEFDPAAFLFRKANHGLLTGSLLLNGLVAQIVGGALDLGTSDAGLAATLTGQTHTFEYSGDQFYLSSADAKVVPLPAALPLLAGGLSVLGFAAWRRRKSA